jgi:hypothetical protein
MRQHHLLYQLVVKRVFSEIVRAIYQMIKVVVLTYIELSCVNKLQKNAKGLMSKIKLSTVRLKNYQIKMNTLAFVAMVETLKNRINDEKNYIYYWIGNH